MAFPKHAIAAPQRDRQPDVPQCGIRRVRVGKPFHGTAQRDHRGVVTPGAGLRETKRDNAIGTRRIEGGERFELIDGARVLAFERIHLRQRLARSRLIAGRTFAPERVRAAQLLEARC